LICRSPESSRHLDLGAAAAEALTLAETHRPDLITLDVGPQGEGVAALNELHKAQPRLKIVLLTTSQSKAHLIAALEAGACGYLLKGIGSSELVQRISGIVSGEIYITPGLAVRMLTQLRQLSQPADSQPELTPREEEVLGHVPKGNTNQEIARNFGLSDRTIKHYMPNIMQKLLARNRVGRS